MQKSLKKVNIELQHLQNREAFKMTKYLLNLRFINKMFLE